jgi:hypothetical protein
MDLIEGAKQAAAAVPKITAEVIMCPGRGLDTQYAALEIKVEGFNSPYILVMQMPQLGYQALAEQMDPLEVFNRVASAINFAASAT